MRPWLAAALLIVLPCSFAAPSAAPRETDLDRFMAAVLSRRDDNWKKLQQYILEERERLLVTGPGGTRLFGLSRKYRWFQKDGFFIRSPLTANGVGVGEADRRRYESDWLKRQQKRDERRSERDAKEGKDEPSPVPTEAIGDVLRQQSEPRFVSAAYFLRFKFEPGRYGLAGKEQLDGRELLKVQYYPARLFDDAEDEKRRRERGGEPARPGKGERQDGDEHFDRQMNKVSLVTLWILREERQIVRYVFDNVDMGFLPGRSVLRVDGLTASMQMGEPFPGVWLPKAVAGRVRFGSAAGPMDAAYDISYAGYRQASVTVKVR
ncbi:MAG TPA: hypothetical protein VMW48_00610 [Vicinamibacterales bacterium]|nr:hypothetical protein [Vicinamibacterales bacterium]